VKSGSKERTHVQNNDTNVIEAYDAIEAQGLVKRFGSKIALNDLWLKIPFGEIHGLIGPNGAGKTTALEILSGIIKPTRGFARINDININQFPEKAKSIIGYIPEEPVLYRSLTVKEFLEFIREIYSVPANLWENRMEKYVNILQLNSFLNDFILTLSKGWLKRLLICSVLIREPSVFLLDEPFVSLDPIGVHILKNILKERSQDGAAILLTSHSADIIETLCDRFTILNNGNTIFQGSFLNLQDIYGANLDLEEIFIKIIGDEFS
jgi:ABC-2 type transport system ATP-binding protein